MKTGTGRLAISILMGNKKDLAMIMKNETVDDRRWCQPGDESDKGIIIDPEFQHLIPPPSAAELAGLYRDLDANGCRDALILWKGHNILVDGHTRLAHCREKGNAFSVRDMEFADREAVKAYIEDTQLGRRNLSPAAESYFRGKRYLAAKRQGTRNDLTSGLNDHKTTSESLAEEFHVGEKTIRRDARLAQAVDEVVENSGSEIRGTILARETGLTRGSLLALADLTPEAQRDFVQHLQETGKPPRKPRRRRKAAMLTLPRQWKALVRALLKELKPAKLAEVSVALANAIANQDDDNTGHASERRTGKRVPDTTK